MSKVFQVKPKRIKRSNGTVLTPDMVVTVTTMQHTATPFYNGANEVQEAYMRIYAIWCWHIYNLSSYFVTTQHPLWA